MIKIEYPQNIDVKFFTFPGGEESVKIESPEKLHSGSVVSVKAQIRNSTDLIRLTLLKDAIDQCGVLVSKLRLGYLPYARQDRVCAEGESFSLKVITSFINSMGFDQVEVIDCHSDVGLALLDNVKHIPQETMLEHAMTVHGNDPEVGMVPVKNTFWRKDYYLAVPDAGAVKKSFKAAKVLKTKGMVLCDKIRNMDTGEIIRTTVYDDVYNPVDISGQKFIIVDDICDGGRTFIEIAKVLKKRGAERVELFVTHGIFSNGFVQLRESGIDQIFTTDTWADTDRVDIAQAVVDGYLKVVQV